MTGFTRSCCQGIENFEFDDLVSIKFKFCLTIIYRGIQLNISGPDSLNSNCCAEYEVDLKVKEEWTFLHIDPNRF